MKNTIRPRGTYADYVSGDSKRIEGKVFIFELIRNNKNNPQMVSQESGLPVPFPLSVSFPMVGTIYFKDPVTNQTTPRPIRYAEGEKSIFVDGQTADDKKPKKTVRAAFVKGRMQVFGEDRTILDFMMNWDINQTKEDRDEKKQAKFFLVDTSKLMAKSRQASKAKFDAEDWCWNSSPDRLTAVAELKLNAEQMAQPMEDIRWNMAQITSRNPEEFLKMLEDPKTERRYYLKKAIVKNILSVNERTNGVYWADNINAPLTVAEPGKDPIEDFINKSFSGNGERYYEAIKDAVEPKKALPVQPVAPAVVNEPVVVVDPTSVKQPAIQPVIPVNKPEIIASGQSDTELKTLVVAAVQKGLVSINKTKVWYKYKDKNYRLEAGLIKALREYPIMLDIMTKEVLA